MDVQIEAGWKTVLQEEFSKPYFKDLVRYLRNEKREGRKIYPEGKNIFNAFALTPFDSTRVLLLGQDPYHGAGQAHGLCFSVQKGVKPPPSLQNIFRELHGDLSLPIPAHGNLESWARQGVLLLNTSLTVRAGEPMSHARIGWETFTDAVIRILSEKKDFMIFVFWGRFAQQKEGLVDVRKHLVLKAAHPSPFSAHQGFLGCRHFSRINEALQARGGMPIDFTPGE